MTVTPAVANLKAAVKEKPAYPAAWNNLGVALRKLGDLDGAVMVGGAIAKSKKK